MKNLLIFFLTLLLFSCRSGNNFDKKYFKDISGVQLPKNYNVIETYDNAEFVTGVTLRMDKKTLVDFLNANKFKIAKNDFSFPQLMGEAYLKKEKPPKIGKKGILFLTGHIEKCNWLYIADTTNNLLWAEIRYPDWGGN